MSMDIDHANQTAVERMMEARPILKAVATARDVIPGMKDNLLLHAGPPIEWERMSGPLRGAIIGAMLFEGLCQLEKQRQPRWWKEARSNSIHVTITARSVRWLESYPPR